LGFFPSKALRKDTFLMLISDSHFSGRSFFKEVFDQHSLFYCLGKSQPHPFGTML